MILNRFIPAGGRIFQYTAWGVVLLVLVDLGWRQLQPESELHWLYAFATKSPASRAALIPYEQYSIRSLEQLDQITGQTANGNVLLKFANYATTNPVVENSLCFAYFRANYTLYPGRIFAGPAEKVINNGRDILQAEFNPDSQWLHQHNVRFQLIFANDNVGGGTLRLEILPLQEGPAGMPASKSGGNR